MESIIRQLFYSNLAPNARGYTKNCSCKSATDTIAKNEEILSDELDGKLKKMFLDYANAWGARLMRQKLCRFSQQDLEWVQDLWSTQC